MWPLHKGLPIPGLSHDWSDYKRYRCIQLHTLSLNKENMQQNDVASCASLQQYSTWVWIGFFKNESYQNNIPMKMAFHSFDLEILKLRYTTCHTVQCLGYQTLSLWSQLNKSQSSSSERKHPKASWISSSIKLYNGTNVPFKLCTCTQRLEWMLTSRCTAVNVVNSSRTAKVKVKGEVTADWHFIDLLLHWIKKRKHNSFRL